MKLEIETTADGSNTLFIPDWNERYHSKNGAYIESNYVYIERGLMAIEKNDIRLLEVGLGTGLDVVLTLKNQEKRKIDYYAIEPYPIPESIWKNLFFHHDLQDRKYLSAFQKIHEVPFGITIELAENFFFTKYCTKIQEFEPNIEFNLIYYDAFGPRVQPEMWDLNAVKKIHKLLKINGLVVTYCSQGQFKRNLKEVDFDVKVLPGPPFKREMTRAQKK